MTIDHASPTLNYQEKMGKTPKVPTEAVVVGKEGIKNNW